MGIRTLLHHGFALMDPKMNPTYPCRRKAEGMPTIVMTLSALLSKADASSPVSFENRDRTRWTPRSHVVPVSAQAIRSRR